MPDPKRDNPTPTEQPSRPDPDPRHDEPAPRLIGPEDEDRKVRTDKGEKRPFGVMP